MPSGQSPPRRVRKCRHLSAPPLNQPLSPPDRKRASCVGLCFPLLAERGFTQPVGASPFGRRLRRRVHSLCGDGGLATDGGGLQAASRLAPPAARVAEPWGSNQPLTRPETQKGPLAGAFAFLAERWGVTGFVEALPLGQRLGRSVHLLRGDGRRATGGGGLRAAARLGPPAARVVEPWGSNQTSLSASCAKEKGPVRGLFAQLAERGGCTAALRALPFGRRLRLSVHLLRGDGRRATGGGGLRAAARLAPPAARVVEPWGSNQTPLSARYEKGPLAGAFAFRIWRREGDSNPRSAV